MLYSLMLLSTHVDTQGSLQSRCVILSSLASRHELGRELCLTSLDLSNDQADDLLRIQPARITFRETALWYRALDSHRGVSRIVVYSVLITQALHQDRELRPGTLFPRLPRTKHKSCLFTLSSMMALSSCDLCLTCSNKDIYSETIFALSTQRKLIYTRMLLTILQVLFKILLNSLS